MELSSEKYVVVLVFEHVMSNECYHNFFVLLISFFLNFNFDFRKPWSGPQGILINFLGVFVIAFVVLVIYLVTKVDYRRPAAPEEDHIPLAE